jgi:integrase
MMNAPTPVTLDAIREAAQTLANRHNDTVAAGALKNAELKAAILPVFDKYDALLAERVAAEQAAKAALEALLDRGAPLFRTVRTLEVDGVRCGFRKEPDSLDFADAEAVIDRVEALLQDKAALLVRNQKSLVLDALPGCSADELRSIGVRRIAGADKRFVTIGKNGVERVIEMLIADAMLRQGEGEEEKQPKGKVKIKASKKGEAVAA